jgi:hypothetical protein
MDEYLKDIQDIKSLMENRTRFLSLSGSSGILAGIYALIGAYVANRMAITSQTTAYSDIRNGFLSPIVLKLLAVAALVLLLSLVTAYFFTSRKAQQRNESLWNKASLNALKAFLVPLVTGGIFGLLVLAKGYLMLIGPITLIFYGMALYSASRYTYRDVATLGLMEIGLGLVSMLFPGLGIYFWAIGFGVLHIIYGVIMYYKYDKVEQTSLTKA